MQSFAQILVFYLVLAAGLSERIGHLVRNILAQIADPKRERLGIFAPRGKK
jgi:hypothetical protein